MSLIHIASQYGDVHKQAAESPHGMTARQIEAMQDRFENLLPGITSEASSTNNRRGLFGDSLPAGANWAPRTAQLNGVIPGTATQPGGGNKTMMTQQRPYQPEFESPDRQQYPVHRILANRYWRLFYKLDPVVGNCIDMYGDMPWSKFKMTGPGVDGSILRTMEQMVDETQLLSVLPSMVREFFVVGEVCPHLFFDDEKGYWTHIALHNPDQLEVIDAPFIKMDPIVQFIPDERLRSVLTTNNPLLRGVRERMPPQLLAQLQARQNIPLSPVNATFIPRKLHPYDTRGTSILSRMWRIFMYEDAIFNASIQTARRHAGPLKIAKLGNAQTGWIPGPEHEAKLLQLLAQAELDPHAWLVYHYGIAFETVGTTDRMMTIKNEWEIIERIKLVAMGISKSFLHGEVTYASAATGLQVFLQRLKALRSYFEQKWILPKFFQTMAEINGWIRRSPAEINHRFRVKRSQRELLEEKRYIVPELRWEKSLDPAIDSNLINAMQSLEGLGCKFSRTTKMATAGYSYEEEANKIAQEEEFAKRFLPKTLQQQQQPAPGAGGTPPAPMPPDATTPAPGGDGMSGDMPPPPPMPEGTPAPGGDSPAPAPAALQADGATKKEPSKPKIEKVETKKPGRSSNEALKSAIWVDDKYGNWSADEVADLMALLKTGQTDSPAWARLAEQPEFTVAHDEHFGPDQRGMWDAIVTYLEGDGYPAQDIKELSEILGAEKFLSEQDSADLGALETSLSEDGLADGELFVGAGMRTTKRNLNGDLTERLAAARAKPAPKQSRRPKK